MFRVGFILAHKFVPKTEVFTLQSNEFYIFREISISIWFKILDYMGFTLFSSWNITFDAKNLGCR